MKNSTAIKLVFLLLLAGAVLAAGIYGMQMASGSREVPNDVGGLIKNATCVEATGKCETTTTAGPTPRAIDECRWVAGKGWVTGARQERCTPS